MANFCESQSKVKNVMGKRFKISMLCGVGVWSIDSNSKSKVNPRPYFFREKGKSLEINWLTKR